MPLSERAAEALRELAHAQVSDGDMSWRPSTLILRTLANRHYITSVEDPSVTLRGMARVSLMPGMRSWDLVLASQSMIEQAERRCHDVIRIVGRPCAHDRAEEVVRRARAARIRLAAIDLVRSGKY